MALSEKIKRYFQKDKQKDKKFLTVDLKSAKS
jgi:hypothetical protein